MKKLVLLLILFCGCGPSSMDELIREHQAAEAAGAALMKFQVGELVDIKLGGQGMVVDISGIRGNYFIRTGPDGNYERRWFDEYELERP